MLNKIIYYAALAGIIINIFLFGFGVYLDVLSLQLLSILNIFLLNFVFLRE